MSTDELPEWATTDTGAAAAGSTTSSKRPLLVAGAVGAAILLAGGIGIAVLGGGDGDSVDAGAPNDLAFDETRDTVPQLVDPTEPSTTLATTVPPTSAPEEATEAEEPMETVERMVAETNESSYEFWVTEEVIRVSGALPSQELIDGMEAAMASTYAPGEYEVDLVVDPEATFDITQAVPIYFEDLVLFDSGSAVVSEAGLAIAAAGGESLARNPLMHIAIIGHTDSRGSEESNLILSQQRADAVRDAYIAAGASPSQVTAVGVGEAEPLVPGEGAEADAQNRSVEFLVSFG